jgi:hypothetical protein
VISGCFACTHDKPVIRPLTGVSNEKGPATFLFVGQLRLPVPLWKEWWLERKKALC